MTTLPKRQYGDPLAFLLKEEEKTCKGCKYRAPDGTGAAKCVNPRIDQETADKRCDEYQERT